MLVQGKSLADSLALFQTLKLFLEVGFYVCSNRRNSEFRNLKFRIKFGEFPTCQVELGAPVSIAMGELINSIAIENNKKTSSLFLQNSLRHKDRIEFARHLLDGVFLG